MEQSSDKDQRKKKLNETTTFPVPFSLEENQENLNIVTNKPQQPSKEQIINQAFKFHSQGNISEAKKLYQYLINQGFDDHRVFSNYGVILKDLGNLQEAELSMRKAIQLNPDFADAHYNLGIILKDLGKLEELILLSKSTLSSNSINQGYKLIASLEITIANLIRGNFSEVLLNIYKTNDLINQGAIKTIKDKKIRQYSTAFSRFMNSLYPHLEKGNKNCKLQEIPHFGESHCLSFAHQKLYLSSQIKTIQPVLITGGKAWHFANNKKNQWKDSLTQQIKNHNYSDEVFISFGEIDCRKNEGILNYAIKNNKDISEVCETTIKGYMDYMEQTLSLNYSKKYYFGIPAPTKNKELLDDLDIKRIKMIKLYNSIFKKEVLSRGYFFLDVYTLTSTKDGENNNLYMCDKKHLSPKCLSILFKDHLFKT